MTDSTYKIPFYAKIALIFICIFAVSYILYIGQAIIIPIVFATIIAILLNPFVNYLMRKRLSKSVAISVAVTLSLIAVIGILYIIFSQLSMFSETYPQLKEKFITTSNELTRWISSTFNIRVSKINVWIKETKGEAISDFRIGATLSEITRILIIGMLLPVYLFMILFYKTLLLEFIRKLFRSEHHSTVVEVLGNTKNIIQTYLVGLAFEMIIVAVLNSAGLLLLGIDYAIILGIIGAVLNIIPYIGGVIAITLPTIIAFVTKDSSSYCILVFFVYLLIQFIDNHYIIPKIVASRVQINALISIIVVLIGGAFWGVPGMFLSIPLTAIIKVVFDHIQPLKPWGFLLGNIVPTTSKFSFIKETLIKDKTNY
jgi:predicted PurR-regulated permease PerM